MSTAMDLGTDMELATATRAICADEEAAVTALREFAARAAADLADAPAADIIGWAVTEFGRDFCITASMADAVLPHLVSTIAPGTDVIFLDTGYHFAETIGMRDAVAATLPLTVRTVRPPLTVAEQDATFGPRLHERDPDACCAMRKVDPLARTLKDYRAWGSGVRRADSETRAGVQVVEFDDKRSMVKVNPIAAWTDQDVDEYIAANHILVNPLLAEGFGSIGCAPCTRRLFVGEDARAGRWATSDKTECGLHV